MERPDAGPFATMSRPGSIALSDDLHFEGIGISYAAAVSPDLSMPFPHIAFPSPGAADGTQTNLRLRFENGLGGWSDKVSRYIAQGHSLKAIVIEYGKNDGYSFIRYGADYVSGLMRSMGVPNELAVHDGDHDSTLGRRLESAMLPAMSRALAGSGQK